MRSGTNKATASSVTESVMSNSTETSCPRWRSSAPSRWVRLLKAWVSSKIRMDCRATLAMTAMKKFAISAPLANAWQLVAGQPIDDASATKGGGELHKMMRVGDHPVSYTHLRAHETGRK